MSDAKTIIALGKVLDAIEIRNPRKFLDAFKKYDPDWVWPDDFELDFKEFDRVVRRSIVEVATGGRVRD